MTPVKSGISIALLLSLGVVISLFRVSASAPPRTALTTSTRVSVLGFGPVSAGMSLRAAERAAGDKLVYAQEISDGCTFVKPVHGPKGISFMVIDGAFLVRMFRGESAAEQFVGPGTFL